MDFTETREEIKRDLAEMGHIVKPKSMQNKIVEGNSDYETKELRNYVYTILEPSVDEIVSFTTQPWADAEAAERFSGERLNPGEAYKHREELWNEFMVEGKQDYSYPERFNPITIDHIREDIFGTITDVDLIDLDQLNEIANELAENPDSRQCFLSIWEPGDIQHIGGKKRVPCTLGYQFMVRDGELHVTYFQRSCDFITHYSNDVYLAILTAKEVAQRIQDRNDILYPIGSFTHFVSSMHVYNKDIEGVF
ncbi:MAG: thymidylate synthase [Fusobacteriaceae bacterium]